MAFGSKRRLVTLSQGVPVWPARGEDGSVATLDLDFVDDRYWWGGARKQRSDLTISQGTPTWDANGMAPGTNGRVQIPTMSWMGDQTEGTLECEYDRNENLGDGYVFTLSVGSGATASRFELGENLTLHAAYFYENVYDGTQTTIVSGYGNGAVTPRIARSVMSFKTGELVRGATGTGLAVNFSATNQKTPVPPFNVNAVGYSARFGNGYNNSYIRRIIFWPKRYSDDFVSVRALKSRKTNIHMLGDSFTNPSLRDAIYAGAGKDDYRVMTIDGVGGSTLSAQATRWAASPQYYDRTLVLMDGSGPDEDIASVYLPKIAEIAGRLNHGRWLYVQGGINRTSSSGAVATALAAYAQIAAAYPGNYVSTYDYMRANGTGALTGSGGGEVWPADCYDDDLHPSAQGNTVLGACIGAALNARGW